MSTVGNKTKVETQTKRARSPFAIRGALEGFYGTFYTFAQRHDLIRFLGRQGFNFYLYGPKDDVYHRLRWREPYPAREIEQFARTAQVAREAGLTFAYALSPGPSIVYSSPQDFACVTDKFGAFYDLGLRAFSLFLDDIVPGFNHEADERHFDTYAAAHADLCNRTYAWLQELDSACSLSMCPTDYAGVAPFSPYLHELGRRLHPAIDVFYTGPRVCSTTITAGDAHDFAQAVGRAPLVWDNYPVNDLGMRLELHLGPLRGRGADLHESVGGLLANLMSQPEASKIALHTFAAYFDDPQGYDAQQAWRAALRDVAGRQNAEPLRLLGENSLHSCLGTPQSEKMDALAQDALHALQQGATAGDSPAVAALQEYLLKLDEACYHLRYYMSNRPLRQELLPWTESLDLKQKMGRYALRTLRALEQGQPADRLAHRLQELLAEVQKRPRRIGGKALLPLARYALQRAETDT